MMVIIIIFQFVERRLSNEFGIGCFIEMMHRNELSESARLLINYTHS